jgi:hypothetical protein
LTTYATGVLIGLGAAFMLTADWQQAELLRWFSLNLGSSAWAFGTCASFFVAVMLFLAAELDKPRDGTPRFEKVVHLDQLSDLLAHLFVGIGVIWTAVGMRNALVNTLSVPDSLANDAGQVLGRLVDGGILLALTTTIIGAIGGYLMRLTKTIYLGAQLTGFYEAHEKHGLNETLLRLESIEKLLAHSTPGGSAHVAVPVRHEDGNHAT